jgi:RNA polymerase sigma factor (sigma-70 family)
LRERFTNLFLNLGIMMSGQEVLNKIRQDESYFREIYKEHRTYTLNYFSRNWSSVDEHTLTDIYQNALVVLLEKSRDPEFELTCNVQTYLNSICRNQLLNKKKSGDSMMNNSDEFDENIIDWLESFDNVKEERLRLIENKLNQLKTDGGKCYELLARFFYKEESFASIAQTMGYTNANNAKHQKARCQKKLKQMVL